MVNVKAILPVALWTGVIGVTGSTASATNEFEQRHPSYVLGPETAYHGKDVEEIARSIRRRSDLMLEAMASLDAAAVNAFYADDTSYVGSGVIGDWKAIIGGTAARYAQRKSVDCNWTNPFRIDVLTRDIAVVTAKVNCTIVDQNEKIAKLSTTRLEVLRRLAKGWTIIAFHEAGVLPLDRGDTQ